MGRRKGWKSCCVCYTQAPPEEMSGRYCLACREVSSRIAKLHRERPSDRRPEAAPVAVRARLV